MCVCVCLGAVLRQARARSQRRPWDGEDGADFIEWSKKQELLEEQVADGEGEGLDADEDEEGDGKDDSGAFNWDGIESDLFGVANEKKKKGKDDDD